MESIGDPSGSSLFQTHAHTNGHRPKQNHEHSKVFCMREEGLEGVEEGEKKDA